MNVQGSIVPSISQELPWKSGTNQWIVFDLTSSHRTRKSCLNGIRLHLESNKDKIGSMLSDCEPLDRVSGLECPSFYNCTVPNMPFDVDSVMLLDNSQTNGVIHQRKRGIMIRRGGTDECVNADTPIPACTDQNFTQSQQGSVYDPFLAFYDMDLLDSSTNLLPLSLFLIVAGSCLMAIALIVGHFSMVAVRRELQRENDLL